MTSMRHVTRVSIFLMTAALLAGCSTVGGIFKQKKKTSLPGGASRGVGKRGRDRHRPPPRSAADELAGGRSQYRVGPVGRQRPQVGRACRARQRAWGPLDP